MSKIYAALLLGLLMTGFTASQNVKIKIVAPKAWNDRKAILLTREKGFAAIVHSIKLGFDTTHLRMDPDLLPDLYQFQVSQKKGALTFFFEPGTEIRIDTTDLSKSRVTRSRSNMEWETFRNTIQAPSDKRLDTFVLAEARARKKSQADSAQYWVARQAQERDQLMSETAAFIGNHPQSYVSLYLLKGYWYAFKGKGLLEKLDHSLAHHRNYRFLKERSKDVVRK